MRLIVRIVFPLLFGANYFSDFRFFPLNRMEDYPVWLVSLVGAIWKKLRGVDAMGLGDVKMMFAVGALLGWRLTLLSIFLGAFSGAIIGIILIARQKEKDLQMQIPFGIFLGIGSILALLLASN